MDDERPAFSYTLNRDDGSLLMYAHGKVIGGVRRAGVKDGFDKTMIVTIVCGMVSDFVKRWSKAPGGPVVDETVSEYITGLAQMTIDICTELGRERATQKPYDHKEYIQAYRGHQPAT